MPEKLVPIPCPRMYISNPVLTNSKFNYFSRYKVEVSGRGVPVLRNGEKGRFAAILFENYTKYLELDSWNRNMLDKYCGEYDVGIVGFMPSRDETFVGAALRHAPAPILIDTNVRVKVGLWVP